jgi:hypothetical protein
MRRLVVTFLLFTALAAEASGESPLDRFDFLAGYCWRGLFETSAADTHCYTWVYGGKHLRDVHVVQGEGPDYLGESVYSVDGDSGEVVFRYWNSLGGVSDGRIVFEGGAIVAPAEKYVGEDGREREFRSTLRSLGKDRYEAITEELVDGEWNASSRVEFTRTGPAPADGTVPGEC